MSYIILARPNCPYCTKATDLMKEHRQSFSYYDLYEQTWLLKLVKDAGRTTVPIIFDNNGNEIGGYAELETHFESIS